MNEKTKQKIAGGIATAAIAGGLLFGGGMDKKEDIRLARLDLLQQAEFTEKHPEMCKGKNADERCLDVQEFLLLTREMNEVKNVKTDKVKKTIKQKFEDKLLK